MPPGESRVPESKEMTAMQPTRTLTLTMAFIVCVAFVLTHAQAQSQADMAPVNDRPNPYLTVDDHFVMPIANMPRAGEPGRTWGSMPAMDTDIDGTSIWVSERCGANSCIGSDVAAVHKFDASGKLVKSFGAGMFAWPHGIHVDQEGHVWVTDGGSATPEELEEYPDATNKGHTVVLSLSSTPRTWKSSKRASKSEAGASSRRFSIFPAGVVFTSPTLAATC